MNDGETVLSGPGGGPGGGAPGAADIDAKVRAEAIRRGLITRAQGDSALEEARAAGVPVLDVLVRRSLLSEEAARDLDGELKEDFVPGYRILSKLGEGGMGVVYRALQKRLDRVVALKVVMPHLAADPSYLKRFEREARAVAKLNHPSIVAAYDYGESDGRVYLAMEFVEGTNAGDAIRAGGPMSEERALAVVRDVAAGLAHAHAAGILHRDVKPANILLAADRPGETGARTGSGAKVTDLGLARSSDARGGTELTAAGAILGTPGYMAPEQAFGMEIDQRADIYALGATLYQFLTGQRPFDAPTPVAVIARQQTDRLRDPRDFVPAISGPVVALLQGMLARDPADRHPGWKEVLADLDRVARGEMPVQPPPPPARASIDAPRGGAPVTVAQSSSPGATVASPPPESARMAAAGSPSSASAAPVPKRTLLAAVGVVAAAGLLFALLRGGPEGGKGTPEGPGGGGAPPKAPADPSPPAEEDPFPADAARRFEEAAEEGDERRAVEEFLASWRRFQKLSPEGRKRHAGRSAALAEALERTGRIVESRFQALAAEGEYGKAADVLRWVKERMGKETPPKLEIALLRVEAALEEDRGAAERRAFDGARRARDAGDPDAVLAALAGYEEAFSFSFRTEKAAAMRAWAEGERPLVMLETEPTGARLLVAGEEIGKAPQSRRFAPGEIVVEARRAGAPALRKPLVVEKRPGQSFVLTLPELDPVVRKDLEPAGNPRALWNGSSLDGWRFEGGGQWGASDPGRKAFLAGVEKAEPAAHLRGSADGHAWLARPVGPVLGAASAWRLDWQMFGEQKAGAAPVRVEMQVAGEGEGRVVVVGIDGGGAYFGRRDAAGTLARTHEDPAVRGGERHTFTLLFDGRAYGAEVDGKPLGAATGTIAAGGALRAAVEGGAGFFSDFEFVPLKAE